jgi:hypothetical protein
MIFAVRCTNLFGIIMPGVVAMATYDSFSEAWRPLLFLFRMVCIDGFELVCPKNEHKNDGA